MPPSSSLSLIAADQLENVNVVANNAFAPTAAGTKRPHPRFLDLPTEVHIEIFRYVLVEEGKLYPHSTRHARGEPRLQRRPQGYYKEARDSESRFLGPMAEVLEMGLVVKSLLPVVREIFFGDNCFDLGTNQRWLRGIHPDLRVLIRDVETSLSHFSRIVPRRGAVIDFFQAQFRIRRLHISIDDVGFEKHYLRMHGRSGETIAREQVLKMAPEFRALSRMRGIGKVTVDFTNRSQPLSPPAPSWLLAQAAWLQHAMEQG
jgi:hypothetical protein